MKRFISLLAISLYTISLIAQIDLKNDQRSLKANYSALHLNNEQIEAFNAIEKKYTRLVLAVGERSLSNEQKINALIELLIAKDKELKLVFNEHQFQSYLKFTHYQKEQLYIEQLKYNRFYQHMVQLVLLQDQQTKYLKTIVNYSQKIKKIQTAIKYTAFEKQLHIQALMLKQHEAIKEILNPTQYDIYKGLFKK